MPVPDQIEAAFAKLAQLQAGGLVVSGGAFLTSQSEKLAALAMRHAAPTVFTNREFVVAGGLLGYGSDYSGRLPPSRHLYWPYSQGRQACRLACSTGH